ncbi:MAG TPA: hypothetical protein VN690_09020 [Terriglobales bacterium]|nr:hypothetical protein [Terriglobales bacterium]
MRPARAHLHTAAGRLWPLLLGLVCATHAACAQGTPSRAPAHPNCLAYQDGNAVKLRCGASTATALRASKALWSFAILGGDAIVYQTQYTVPINKEMGREVDSRITIRRPGAEVGVEGTADSAYYLAATCGTITADQQLFADRDARPLFDVFTGAPIRVEGLTEPACSADRKRAIGIDADGRLATNDGRVIAEKPANMEQAGYGHDFAISPSGEWIAWHKSVPIETVRNDQAWNWVCVSQWNGPLSGECSALDQPYAVRRAVADDGEVAFQDVTGAKCGNDECVAIFVLRNGKRQPVVPDGNEPQWVPYADAQRLIALYAVRPGAKPRS